MSTGLSSENLPAVLTVRELTGYIKRLLESDELLQDVVVRGEVSNFKRHRSGHLYFTLKDDEAALECVCFRNIAATIGFLPEDGMQVVAGGRVSVYERQGRYQLLVFFMRPDGLGALRAAFEKLRAKLQAEGLFDASRKRPLPRFPRCIALVTSPDGAAVRDLTSIIGRRFPLARMIIVPTLVQGERAADSIVESLRLADSIEEVDLIIFGRGGGSAEDLWPFNEERVARAIYACRKPTISAVGHETDVTIADLVADVRAATPSAAAELAVPDRAELLQHIANLRQRAALAVGRRVENLRGRLSKLTGRRALAHPEGITEPRRLRVAGAEKRAADAMEMKLVENRRRLDVLKVALQAHQPSRMVRQWLEHVQRMMLRAQGALVGMTADARARLNVVRTSLAARSPLRMVADSRMRLAAARRAAAIAVRQRLEMDRERWRALDRRVDVRWLMQGLAQRRRALALAVERSAQAAGKQVEVARWRLSRLRAKLFALDPRAVLRRGYSITFREPGAEVVKSAEQVAADEQVRIVLSQGEIDATVSQVRATATLPGLATEGRDEDGQQLDD